MTGLRMYLICLSVLAGSVYAGKGSAASNACPVKCDVVQELTLLRQLLNQESILRMNSNNEIKDLKKLITRTKNSITAMQQDNRATKQKLTTLESSVNTVKANNRATRRDLTKLERTVTSINQTYQGKPALSSDTLQS